MKSNEYCFAIVVNKRVTKTFFHHTDNFMALGQGMMYVEFTYHKTASMYVYRLNNDNNMYEFIHSFDADKNTIMPTSFEKDSKPFTLNHIATSNK